MPAAMSNRRTRVKLHVHVFLGLVLSAGVPNLDLFGVKGVSAEVVCEHNILYTLANCSDRGLDRVPWGLHHNIDTLELSNNRSVPGGLARSMTTIAFGGVPLESYYILNLILGDTRQTVFVRVGLYSCSRQTILRFLIMIPVSHTMCVPC